MENTRRTNLALLFFCVLVFNFSPHKVEAQQLGAGIQIVPATIEDLAEPGETLDVELTITNLNSEDTQFFLYTREIKGVEDGGTPVFADPGAEVTGYEITEWIEFGTSSVVIPADSDFILPVRINVPVDATPGSHFGGIFVSREAPRLRQIGAGVGYEVAAIVSIRVAGDVVDDARIRSFSTDKLIHGSKDVTFITRVENQGNILIRPRGPLVITNMLGQEVETITVNDNLAGVFPGTTREITADWSDESLGFGRYEAILALAYDGDNGRKTINASLSFWVLPSQIIIPILVTSVVVGGLGYFLLRLYVRNTIARVSGGQRLVQQRYRRRTGMSRFTFVFVSLLTVMVIFMIFLLILLA